MDLLHLDKCVGAGHSHLPIAGKKEMGLKVSPRVSLLCMSQLLIGRLVNCCMWPGKERQKGKEAPKVGGNSKMRHLEEVTAPVSSQSPSILIIQ